LYKAYKRGCPTALDSIAIKSTEDTNAVVQPWWKVQHTTTVLQKLRWKMAQSSKITKTGTYQCGCRVNRAGMCQFFFFFQMAAVIRCCPIPKFNCCCTTKIHLLLPKPKSNISNSIHTQFKIQNPISPIQHILNSKFKFPQTQQF